MFNRLNKLFLYLFLISLFFFKIPNFYILPFFKNPFLTTQALSRIIIILTFAYQVIIHSLAHKKLFTDRNSRTTVLFIIGFFLLQSFSIVATINLGSFLSRYKDVIISFLAFFVFFFYKKNYLLIISVLITSIVVNSIYQFMMVFYQDYFVKVVSNFVYQKHADLAIAKLYQNRVYLDTYDEISPPFLFIFRSKNNLRKNLSFYILFILISFFSLVSNIRSRILMLLVSLGGTLVFIKKINFKKVFIVTFSFLLIGFLINNFMRYYSGFSFVDRILLQDEIEDIKPVNFRLEQIKNSLEMGKASLLGVGLGNYYDNLTSKNSFIINKSQLVASQGAQEFVHDIFGAILSESGYISLTVFLIILWLFIKRDIYLLKKGKDYEKAFIIAFWSLFSYGLFNPILPVSYQVLFWGIRGLLLD